MIEAISGATRAPALEYLARSPYLNVFLSHVLLHNASLGERTHVAVAIEGPDVRGVAYWGRQLVLAAEPPTIAEFAEHAKRHRGERMIVGARDTVREYWEAVRGWHAPARLVRDRQYVMMVDRPRLRRHERRGVTIRHAQLDEWRAVAESSAEMVRHELGYDPRRGAPEFGAGIREMIERNLWWVGIADGRICFFCNVGPWCTKTIQLQGIWTPPGLRGQGYATRSLAALCDRLLDVSPTLSLYVNDFNERAIALYQRVGFARVGDFQTILF